MKFNLPYQFKNPTLLEISLTHRSYLNEHKKLKLISNERMEFLGDAVLELIVSQYLYRKFPQYPEGKLTNLRSSLVQTKTLSIASQKLGLGEQIKMSKGEKESLGNTNPTILANTYEAVIGAIFLDSSLEETEKFILETLLIPAKKSFAFDLPIDYKSKLQEKIQAGGMMAPTYQVIRTFGPDHKKTFEVGLEIKGKIVSIGKGSSKQEAEQQAAKNKLLN